MSPKRRPVVFWLVCSVLFSGFAMAEPPGGDARKTLTYAGVVTDEEGLPIAGVKVGATPLEEGGEPQTTMTDRQGRFVLFGVSQFYHDHTWRYLVCEHRDYGFAWRQLTEIESRNPNFDPSDLHLRMLPPAKFSGLVTNTTGQPVNGAEVSAHLKQTFNVTSHVRKSSYYSVTATTNDKGHFQFPNLPKDAELELQVCHPEYVTFWHKAERGSFPYKIDEGPVKVQLLPGASVQGRLLLNGKQLPQSGAMIHVTDPQKGKVAGWARTDAEGRYRITGLEENSYAVHVLGGEELFGGLVAAPVQHVTVESGKTVIADLICVRGVAVTGRVIDRQGHAVDQSYVRARLFELPNLNLYGTTTDGNGCFRLPLPAGSYEINVSDWRFVPPLNAVGKVVVADAPPKPIEFQVTGGAALKTHLVDTAGRDVRGSATIYGNWSHSDERGNIAFRFVPGARSLRAGFAISDDKTLAAGFYWPAGNEEPPKEVVLKPPATLTGRVLFESGAKVTADMFVFAWTWTDGAQSTIGWQDGIAWPRIKDDGTFRVMLPTGVPLTITVSNGIQEKKILPPTNLEPGETRDVGEVQLHRSDSRGAAPAIGRAGQ